VRPKNTVTGAFLGDIPVMTTESYVRTSLVVMTRMFEVSMTAQENDVPDALVHVIVVSEDHLVTSVVVRPMLALKVLSKYPKFTAAMEKRRP
jgi:hypothetical protein